MSTIVQPISLICLFNTSRRNFTFHSSKSVAMITDKVLFSSRNHIGDGREVLSTPNLVILLLMALWEDFLKFLDQCPMES